MLTTTAESGSVAEEESGPMQQCGGLVERLIALAGWLKELETQSHLIHLNAEGPEFLQVHAFLKERYEEHLEQFDTVAELVRVLDNFMPMCSCGLKGAAEGFRNCETYELRQMLLTYYCNLDGLIGQATALESMAGEGKLTDVANYMAELVASAGKTSWMIKAMLRG